jgi:hypothetical protein
MNKGQSQNPQLQVMKTLHHIGTAPYLNLTSILRLMLPIRLQVY